MRRVHLKPAEPFTSALINRTGAFNAGALEAATRIVAQVREGGDAALRQLTAQFDGVELGSLRVPQKAIDAAPGQIDQIGRAHV